MLSVCGMVGRYVVDWGSTFWIMIGAAYVTCLNTGLRKCSISTAHPDDLYATLANIVVVRRRRVVHGADRAQLETVKDGDLMRFMPPMGDKTDAFGQNFGHEYMYFRVDSADPLSCAHWLLKRELCAPPAGRRDATPLFSPDGGTRLSRRLSSTASFSNGSPHSWARQGS